MTMLARLKPYNERKGHKTRVYMIDGVRFLEERGWYEISEGMAEKLRPLHQEHYEADSPLLFDVCTVEEADKLDQAAQQSTEMVRASARFPAAALSTRNVTVPPSRTLPQETGDVKTTDGKASDRNLPPPTDKDGAVVKPAGVEILDDGSWKRADGTHVKPDGTQILEDGTEIPPEKVGMIDPDPEGKELLEERELERKEAERKELERKELEHDTDDDAGRALEVGRVRGSNDPKNRGPQPRPRR